MTNDQPNQKKFISNFLYLYLTHTDEKKSKPLPKKVCSVATVLITKETLHLHYI